MKQNALPPTVTGRHRRSTALGAVVVAGLITASGCSSSSTGSGATTNDSTTSGSRTSSATPSATSTPAATTGAGATTTASATATTASASGTTGSASSNASVADVAAAGTAFLNLLDANEKAAGVFEYSNTPQKAKWSNFPNSIFPRSGIQWGTLSAAKQTAWLAMVQKSLSAEGYARFLAEWKADDALASQQGGGGNMFGSNLFYIALIGTPSATTPWMYQFGGHHVTLNVTIAGGRISPTPSFVGDQPTSYTDANGKTVVPLGDISDDAYALLGMLDATQKTAAVLGTSVIDVVLGPGQDGKTIATEGLLGSKMTDAQQAQLLKLIMHYAGMANDTETARRLAEIKADLSNTAFAWYGSTTAGQSAYFRVTGPTVVIEYSPQGGGGPNAAATGAPTHIHGIYRDPTNDYGTKYD